jgi:hypothetical protein
LLPPAWWMAWQCIHPLVAKTEAPCARWSRVDAKHASEQTRARPEAVNHDLIEQPLRAQWALPQGHCVCATAHSLK